METATATSHLEGKVVQRRRICRSCGKTKLLSKYPPSINNSIHHCSKCLFLCVSCGSPLITLDTIQKCDNLNCISNARRSKYYANNNYSQKCNKYWEFKKRVETYDSKLQLFAKQMYNKFSFQSKDVFITPDPIFSDDDIAQIRTWILDVNPDGIHEPINFDIKGKMKNSFKLRQ
jgi:hypothetical protein